jgi:hypothetical protein
MARQTGARLHVIHVVPPVTDPADSAERLTLEAKTLGDGVPTESALLRGRPARQIVEYARNQRIGLIVLGTHGRSGMSRAILGSVAEGVVRLAPCLVLTVPLAILEASGLVPAPVDVPALRRCIVCARDSDVDELVCETCRTKIRAEASARKREAERS